MNFNTHYDLLGKHSFLSPSKHYWANWDEEKVETSFYNFMASARGTRLHDFAAEAISLGIKLQGNKTTLSMYVNDAIGYSMTPEQPLYYSENCFGHADAISFKRNVLRVHDLKTGEITPGSMMQLKIYAALFCLEYHVDPYSIRTELRIYQFDDVAIEEPDPEEIEKIMTKIIVFDKKIQQLRTEE